MHVISDNSLSTTMTALLDMRRNYASNTQIASNVNRAITELQRYSLDKQRLQDGTRKIMVAQLEVR